MAVITSPSFKPPFRALPPGLICGKRDVINKIKKEKLVQLQLVVKPPNETVHGTDTACIQNLLLCQAHGFPPVCKTYKKCPMSLPLQEFEPETPIRCCHKPQDTFSL